MQWLGASLSVVFPPFISKRMLNLGSTQIKAGNY